MKKIFAILTFLLVTFGAVAQSPPPFTNFIPWHPCTNCPPDPLPTGPLVLTKLGVLKLPGVTNKSRIWLSTNLTDWFFYTNLAAGATCTVAMPGPGRFWQAEVIMPLFVWVSNKSGTISGNSSKSLTNITATLGTNVQQGWQRRQYGNPTAGNYTATNAEFRFPALGAGTWSLKCIDEDGQTNTQNVAVTAGFAAASSPVPFSFDDPVAGTWMVDGHFFKYVYDKQTADASDYYESWTGDFGRYSYIKIDKTSDAVPDYVHHACSTPYGGNWLTVTNQHPAGECGPPYFPTMPESRSYPLVAEWANYSDAQWHVVGGINHDVMYRKANSNARMTLPGLPGLHPYKITLSLYSVTNRFGSEVEFSSCTRDVIKSLGGMGKWSHSGGDTIFNFWKQGGSTIDVTPRFNPWTAGWFSYYLEVLKLD